MINPGFTLATSLVTSLGKTSARSFQNVRFPRSISVPLLAAVRILSRASWDWLKLVTIAVLSNSPNVNPPYLQGKQQLMYNTINTHYYNSNLIWCTVSQRVDEVIPLDQPRREASRVIHWYGLIQET